jgi:hypothetical protein
MLWLEKDQVLFNNVTKTIIFLKTRLTLEMEPKSAT